MRIIANRGCCAAAAALALRWMRRMQNIFVSGGAVGAILLRRRPLAAVPLVLAGLFLHDFLRKFATAIEGNTYRGEVDDRSVAALN